MSDLINPNDYGVLPTGFSRMRLPEIRTSIVNTLNATLGIQLETRPDSITGQFIDTFAEREATLWELAEAVYHAMYPVSAFGVNLDHAVSFAGVRRLFAQRSNAPVIFYGAEGTVIAAGTLIRNSQTQEEFTTRAEVMISRQAAIDITLAVGAVVIDANYWIRINTVLFNHLATQFDTSLTIAESLAQQLQAARLEQQLDANVMRVWTLESVAFAVQFSTNIELREAGSGGFVDAVNFGPVTVDAGSLNGIVTLIDGFDRVNNLVAGHVGRNLETDDELRARYDRGVYRLGAATLPAIRANLQQNIVGLIAVEVFENPEDFTDSEGRPPHSIEVVAYGGDPVDIADEIFRLKAAGIDTHGDVSLQVVDSAGYPHTINFNRPTPVYFWVHVDVTLYSREVFPDDGVQRIQRIVADTGNGFGIGTDVIIQRFIGPIFAAVPGIQRLDIMVAYTEDANHIPAPGEYLAQNVMLVARQLAHFDTTRVSVVILP